MGAMPPHSTDVLWLDISDGAAPILKMFINGNWEAVTTDTLVEDEIIGMYCIKEPGGGEEKPTITIDSNNLQNSDWSNIDDYLTGGTYLLNVKQVGEALCGGVLTVYDFSLIPSSYIEIMQVVLVGRQIFTRVKYSGQWSALTTGQIPLINDSGVTEDVTWSARRLTELDTKVNSLEHGKIENVSSPVSPMTLQSDIYYNISTDISDLRFNLEATTGLPHYHVVFTCSNGNITFPLIEWIGETPTFEAGHKYEVDICNNIGICIEIS